MALDRNTIQIKTLTPLWTGDVNRECNEVKETGIIGSLRWWYEALVRGLGGYACDVTSENPKERCDYGRDKEKICDACKLFGCTGWGRKFKLEAGLANSMDPLNIGTRTGPKGKSSPRRIIRGVISKNPLTLTIWPLREITENEWALLNRTLKIIEDYGALGAHSSQGNGVIEILQNSLPGQESGIDIENFKPRDTYCPNLGDFFFYKFQLEFMGDIDKLIEEKAFWIHQGFDHQFNDDEEFRKWKELWNTYHFLPVAPHMRDTIRRFEFDKGKRHAVLGERGRGSKVFVSHGYMISSRVVETRIWGYEDNGFRERIKEDLGTKLKSYLFCESSKEHPLKECRLTNEKTGEELIKELM
jgi:CRISPR-associated protein Cmr1